LLLKVFNNTRVVLEAEVYMEVRLQNRTPYGVAPEP
jgi:hypothetical protein